MNPHVSFDVITSREHSVAGWVWAGKGLFSGMRSNVPFELVLSVKCLGAAVAFFGEELADEFLFFRSFGLGAGFFFNFWSNWF